jgi:predicted transcriptional regulator
MKNIEQKKARELRKGGVAMGDIAKQLNVSKSSVSYWVRDIVLSKKIQNALNANGHSVGAIEKRRVSRLARTKSEHDAVFAAAMLEARHLFKNPLWCVGVSLYWGEGGKTQATARIANSDPIVIKTMMRFFREVCKIPEEKFRVHIHTFAHCDHIEAERYWSEITTLPLSQFYKTYKKQSSVSKNKRDTLPLGTIQIYVHEKNFFFRIMGWMEYIKQQYD